MANIGSTVARRTICIPNRVESVCFKLSTLSVDQRSALCSGHTQTKWAPVCAHAHSWEARRKGYSGLIFPVAALGVHGKDAQEITTVECLYNSHRSAELCLGNAGNAARNRPPWWSLLLRSGKFCRRYSNIPWVSHSPQRAATSRYLGCLQS